MSATELVDLDKKNRFLEIDESKLKSVIKIQIADTFLKVFHYKNCQNVFCIPSKCQKLCLPCSLTLFRLGYFYLLTNWLAYLYGRIQSPRPDVMPDRREGITRAAGFVFACIDTQAS